MSLECDPRFPVTLRAWAGHGNSTETKSEVPCNTTGAVLVNLTGVAEYQVTYFGGAEPAAEETRRRRQLAQDPCRSSYRTRDDCWARWSCSPAGRPKRA